jgi:hypothetical protein
MAVILVLLCVYAAWGEEVGKVDEQNMQESYEWSIIYIRALTAMNERLYRERNLERMTRLHSALDSKSKGVFRTAEEILKISWFSILVNDFHYHQTRREHGDMTVGDVFLPWIKIQDSWFDMKK